MIRRLLQNDAPDEMWWVNEFGLAHSHGKYDADADTFTIRKHECRVDLGDAMCVRTREHGDDWVVLAVTDGLRQHPEDEVTDRSVLAEPREVFDDDGGIREDLQEDLEAEREKYDAGSSEREMLRELAILVELAAAEAGGSR